MSTDSHSSLSVHDLKQRAQQGGSHAQRPCRSKIIVFAASALLVVVLALGLGLGLGLGLRNHNHSANPPQNVSSNIMETVNSPNLPQLLPTPPNNFVLGTIKGQRPQTRFYHFTISKVQGAPDGVSKPMLVANGMSPGPTIEANQWDRIVVNVTNNLDTRTAIHWHGLYQNKTNYYDGTTGITECGIPPGQFLVYNFTLGEFYGTTWYHSHFSTQYTDGLTGALVIHPTDPAPKNIPKWDGEIMVQMTDVYHNFSQELLNAYLSPSGIDGTPGDEPVPDGGSLNGLGQYGGGGDYFNFTLEDDKTYRIRLVNSGSLAPIRFSIDYHPLTIIEVDGTFVKPYVVTGLTIAVAQRYSVLIHTNQTEGHGRYWMRTLLQSNMFTYVQPGQNVDIRGVLKYASGVKNQSLPSAGADPGVPSRKDIGDMDTASLVPAVVSRPPNPTRPYYVNFDFEDNANGVNLAYINGTSWTPLSGNTTLLKVRNAFLTSTTYAPVGGSVQPGDQFLLTEDSIQVVDLIIDNLDNGDHPFHLHGHTPWIMGVGTGRYQGQALNTANALRRDTMVIPADGYTVIRFITDNPGVWAFHCHLVWHMAAGLLMQINSLPTKTGQLDIPQVIIDQCNASAPGE